MKRGRKEIDYTPVRVCFSLHPSQVEGVKQIVKDYRKRGDVKCEMCGSTDMVEVPHFGRNCNRCNN